MPLTVSKESQTEREPETPAPRRAVVLHARVVTGTGGGPEKTIINSPRFLTPWGFHSICAYMHPPGDPGFEELRARAERSGVELLSVPDRGAIDWQAVQAMADLCRREGVTIWHGHDYKTNALGLLLRRKHPMKLVATTHGWVERTWKTPLYYAIDRLALRAYDRVICVSEDLRQRCLKSGVRPERCQVIDNAIDTDEYQRTLSIAEAKRQCGFQPENFLLVGLGRLSEEKGFDRLIQAARILSQKRPEIRVAIGGEGNQREPLERLIASSGLADRVRLLGYVPDPRTLLQAADVFVLSSLREGLPNVVLEAMALEVPIVATRVAGVPRAIDDEVNGLVVPPDDVKALAEAVDRFAENTTLREQCAREARRTVEEHFSFAARMEQVRKVYDELIA